jgi:hypothetical protein
MRREHPCFWDFLHMQPKGARPLTVHYLDASVVSVVSLGYFNVVKWNSILLLTGRKWIHP